jgi:hypothetical protein
MAEESQGFFGRWARRKQEVREGRPLPEPLPPVARPPAEPARSVAPAAEQAAPVPPAAAVEPPPPPPTLEDVRTLNPQSDYARFMKSDVDPQVKNAAMKKLFADPHFNVMDGMDVYIDDYNKPDPMPASMLRKLASAQFLKLFDDEKKDQATATTVAAAPVSPADAAPAPEAPPPALPAQDHDDTDLRLQQDHAAGPQGSGRGPQ